MTLSPCQNAPPQDGSEGSTSTEAAAQAPLPPDEHWCWSLFAHQAKLNELGLQHAKNQCEHKEGNTNTQICTYLFLTKGPKQMEVLDCLSNLLAVKRFWTAWIGNRMRCRYPLSPRLIQRLHSNFLVVDVHPWERDCSTGAGTCCEIWVMTSWRKEEEGRRRRRKAFHS